MFRVFVGNNKYLNDQVFKKMMISKTFFFFFRNNDNSCFDHKNVYVLVLEWDYAYLRPSLPFYNI